jgi:uncharacterized protein YcfJ
MCGWKDQGSGAIAVELEVLIQDVMVAVWGSTCLRRQYTVFMYCRNECWQAGLQEIDLAVAGDVCPTEVSAGKGGVGFDFGGSRGRDRLEAGGCVEGGFELAGGGGADVLLLQ